MKRATVVIGANYGDEGKGLLTDFHAAAAGPDALVVRFNGGAQAGHTVVTPDGRRHVFSHVGSGAFVGTPTFLSRFFVANPMLFQREMSLLSALGVVPSVSIDRRAPVTTPWDMLINQTVETARGGGRHGSCGIGFGETIERNLDPSFALTVGGLADRDHLVTTLDAIRRDYLPARLAKLGLSDRWPGLRGLAMSDELFVNYLRDADAFRSAVAVEGACILGRARRVIFEGAQGLLLDQDRGAFPHVTRSNTGLRNVLALAGEAGIEMLDVTYVTRAYVTRHGAGPLSHELDHPPERVRDATNLPNAWQGSVRYAPLDLDRLHWSIADDLSDAPSSIQIDHALAVTCMDQVVEQVTWFSDGRRHTTPPEVLILAAADTVGTKHVLVSAGPTRADIALVELRVSRVA